MSNFLYFSPAQNRLERGELLTKECGEELQTREQNCSEPYEEQLRARDGDKQVLQVAWHEAEFTILYATLNPQQGNHAHLSLSRSYLSTVSRVEKNPRLIPCEHYSTISPITGRLPLFLKNCNTDSSYKNIVEARTESQDENHTGSSITLRITNLAMQGRDENRSEAENLRRPRLIRFLL